MRITYVADFWNHRIVAWPVGAKLLDGSISGREIWPTDFSVSKDDSFIICDPINKWLLRWPRHRGLWLPTSSAEV